MRCQNFIILLIILICAGYLPSSQTVARLDVHLFVINMRLYNFKQFNSVSVFIKHCSGISWQKNNLLSLNH